MHLLLDTNHLLTRNPNNQHPSNPNKKQVSLVSGFGPKRKKDHLCIIWTISFSQVIPKISKFLENKRRTY